MIYCSKKNDYVDQESVCIKKKCKSYVVKTDSCTYPERDSSRVVKSETSTSLESAYREETNSNYPYMRGIH